MYGGNGLQLLVVMLFILPPFGIALLAWVLYGFLNIHALFDDNAYTLLWLRVICLLFACILFGSFGQHGGPFLIGLQVTFAALVSSIVLELLVIVQQAQRVPPPHEEEHK